MNQSVRFASAAAIAAGIHIALFFLMPEVIPRSKQPDSFSTDSVVITMSSLQASLQETQDKMPDPPEQKQKKKNEKVLNPPEPESEQKPESKPEPEEEPEPESALAPESSDTPDTELLKPSKAEPLPDSFENKVPLEKLKKKTFKKPVSSKAKQTPEPRKKSAEQTAEATQLQSLSDRKTTTQTEKKTAPEQADSRPEALPEKSSKKQEAVSQEHETVSMATPLYKSNPLPKYPASARRRGFEGTVEISVLVSEKGTVTKFELAESSGHKSLDQQALETVKQWRFEPGRKNGKTKAMWVKIPITFKLE